MELSVYTALWFLPFAIPISLWAAWSDLKYMKIPNKAVLALLGVFVVVGLVALPFDAYLWRYLHFALVLVLGFALNMVGAIGAGDAKFAAAMAPFVAWGDVMQLLLVFAAVLLAAFLTHRLFRSVPAFRAFTPEWQSWDNKDFPMGFALGGTMIVYLIIGIAAGA